MKKNIIYILLLISLLFCLKMEVKSLTYGGCEYSDVSRLKSIVSNINITYDYYILDNNAYFNITLTNITPDIYFVDSQTGITYNYSNTTDGEITINNYKSKTGNYKFYSALNECYGVKLSNKYYKLPTYNVYYTDDLCQKNQNNSLCQKWANVTYSYSEFKNLIEKYNEKNAEEKEKVNVIYEKTYLDLIVNFYTKYYYFILIGIIVVCVVIMIINKRKNRFDI